MKLDEDIENEEFASEDTLGIAGAVNVDLGLTVNLGNFGSLKLNIGLNEPYSGRIGDTREDKLEELFAFIQSKIDDKAVSLTVHNKELSNILWNTVKEMDP